MSGFCGVRKDTAKTSGCRKPLIQIINDHLGFIHPGGLAILFNAQARHLDLATLFQQGLAILLVVLRITQRHWHVQATQGAAGFHAERAGVELIQGQAFGSRFDLGLSSSGALLLAGAGDEIDEDDQLAKADTKRFYEHGISLTGRKKARSLPDFSQTKKNRR
ncbi:Type VI secretion system tip protein VgrG [Pseudomonas sp. IT-P100]